MDLMDQLPCSASKQGAKGPAGINAKFACGHGQTAIWHISKASLFGVQAGQSLAAQGRAPWRGLRRFPKQKQSGVARRAEFIKLADWHDN